MTRVLSSYPAGPRDYPCGDAVISDDGTYRYALNRRWAPDLPVMPWICLNPSTADARRDDPSVRRMCGFARREGCGGICVLNLYAIRSPSPDVLRGTGCLDPVGPDNDRWLAGLAPGCDPAVPVVAAWGAHPAAAGRRLAVMKLLAGVPVACLGVTASGAPRHPLYVRGDAPLVPYPADAGRLA